MKLSLKNSSLFAAVAMSIYSAFIIIAQTPLYDNVILSVDKYFVLSYVCTSLLLVSMLVLGVSIFINRKQIPVLPKSLLWQTRVITAVLCFMLFCNIFSTASVYINGMLYFWWHGFEWLRYVMLLLMTTWLWQFTLIKSTKTFTAQYLGISGLFVAIAVGIILVLMCLSFIHVLLTDHVIGFRTNVIVSWLKPLSALVFLTSYLSLSRQQNKPS